MPFLSPQSQSVFVVEENPIYILQRSQKRGENILGEPEKLTPDSFYFAYRLSVDVPINVGQRIRRIGRAVQIDFVAD